MFKAEFKMIAGRMRDYNGKQYYYITIKVGEVIYEGETKADVFVKLKEFETYVGHFALFKKNSTGGTVYKLRLEGLG